MYEQLPGSFRNIQVVFKEPLNCEERFMIQQLNGTALKDLFEEHIAKRGRQLINQTGNSEVIITDNQLFCIKHFANFKCDLRFFEGKTQTEVAEEIHISQAQVSRLEKNALKAMRNYLN